MHDEILEAVIRDELLAVGASEDDADAQLEAMRDAGMFEVPDALYG